MVLTFVFMITGWLTAKLGVAWHDVFYVGAYLAGGYFGVRAGLQSLRQWTIDVDLLMVLAALGAAVVNAPFEGAMLLFLFSLSNVLQAYAIDRTRKAIKSLMKLRPEKALARRDGGTVLLPVEELVVGDVLVVRPGESIALDSVIIEGSSAIDQASLTGESMPVSKKVGDPVFAGTINQTGGLEMRVTKLAKDSTIEKLVRMVEEAQTEKADTQRFLDRAEQFYAVGVILFTHRPDCRADPVPARAFPDRVLPRHDRHGRRLAVRADHQHAGLHPLRDRRRGAARRPVQRRRPPRTRGHREGRGLRQDRHAHRRQAARHRRGRRGPRRRFPRRRPMLRRSRCWHSSAPSK